MKGWIVMVELVLWVLLGFVVLSLVLLSLAVVVGYVSQVAYLEHLDDWNKDD